MPVNQPRDTVNEGPSPVDLSIYQNDDSVIAFYPYGVGVTPPAGFSGYTYTIDVWDGLNSSVLLLTSSGGSPQFATAVNTGTGLVTFTLARSTALSLAWSNAKYYDIRETISGVNTTLIAGSLSLLLRGQT